MLSNFNSPLENKLLIYIAEASGTVNHSFQKTFESLISDDYLTIEKKGIDPYSINNHLNFALSTNTSNPIKIDNEDRKWCVYDSEKYSKKDFEFINLVKSDMKEPIVIKCFYEFLMRRNLTNKNWIASRPQTELYNDLKQLNANPLIFFMKSCCDIKIMHGTIECLSQELYEKYVEWLAKNGYETKITTNKFGNDLKNLFKIPKDDEKSLSGMSKRHNKCGTIYIINPSVILNYIMSKF